jgi:hypothetical protein
MANCVQTGSFRYPAFANYFISSDEDCHPAFYRVVLFRLHLEMRILKANLFQLKEIARCAP